MQLMTGNHKELQYEFGLHVHHHQQGKCLSNRKKNEMLTRCLSSSEAIFKSKHHTFLSKVLTHVLVNCVRMNDSQEV